eukprot:jgi/Undpi1/1407/HiC_scaffold_11.g04798.m1
MATPKAEPVGTKALLASLESVVMDLNDMENMIENFEDATAEPFFAKVNEYIVNLKEVEKRSPTCDLQVPREALERLDDDAEQNPEVFAQELLTRCRDEFGQLNARVLGIKKVRQAVMDGWNSGKDADQTNAEVAEPGEVGGRANQASKSVQGVPRNGGGVGQKDAPGRW